jgi:hypothetical protein
MTTLSRTLIASLATAAAGGFGASAARAATGPAVGVPPGLFSSGHLPSIQRRVRRLDR